MAGATVATWVKVRTKTGLTSRPISHKYEGGANYEKGQVITQSEYNDIKANRGEKVSSLKEKSTESSLEATRQALIKAGAKEEDLRNLSASQLVLVKTGALVDTPQEKAMAKAKKSAQKKAQEKGLEFPERAWERNYREKNNIEIPDDFISQFDIPKQLMIYHTGFNEAGSAAKAKWYVKAESERIAQIIKDRGEKKALEDFKKIEDYHGLTTNARTQIDALRRKVEKSQK